MLRIASLGSLSLDPSVSVMVMFLIVLFEKKVLETAVTGNREEKK